MKKYSKIKDFFSGGRRGLKLFRNLIFGFILLVIFIYSFLNYLQPNTKLEIDFLDVGQGDATLVKIPGGQKILIDAGPDNLVLRRLSEKLKFFERTIDLVIISHYHDDHILGLIEILKRYRVKKIIFINYEPNPPLLEAVVKLAAQKDIFSFVLRQALRINFTDNCFLDLLSPEALRVKSDSNNSLISKLSCGRQKFLFTGDNSAKVEQALINSGWDLSANIFKAAHHGSNSANQESFLRAIGARKIIVSVGQDNRFGHPNQKFLDRLVLLGIIVKRTDQEGTIRFNDKY